jgi:hypothetical protein
MSAGYLPELTGMGAFVVCSLLWGLVLLGIACSRRGKGP